MVDIVASVTSAISIAKKLKEASDKIRNADLKNLIGDLSLELADIKVHLAEVIEENSNLKAKIKSLESAEGEPCPKCKRRAWAVAHSKRHPVFGDVGCLLRTYKCAECGFTEDKLIQP
jgi:hypothetical protein